MLAQKCEDRRDCYASSPNQAYLWELLNTSGAFYGTPGAVYYEPGTLLSQLDPGWKIQVSTPVYSPDVQDCAGVFGGSAFLDKCNNCVGGTTGAYPCYVELDCAGVPNGTAYIDSCKVCVGGTTGLLPCEQDCAGIWGGKSYLNTNNECIDTTRKSPCDSIYIAMGESLYAFINKPEFADSLNKFKQGITTDTLEKVISFGLSIRRSTFKTTEIRVSTDQFSVPPIISYDGMLIYKIMHSHTFNAYNCFSAGDLYVLASLFSNPFYQQITSQYVIAADSSIFAMEIEDSTMYAQFLSKYSVKMTMDSVTHGFDTTHSMGRDFNEVFLKLKTSISEDDAFTQATAYVMNQYNSGLVLYRQKKDENKFTKINTKLSINSSGEKIYSIENCP